MATPLSILTGKDNPVLRRRSREIAAVTKEVKKLTERMYATVKKAKGIGLAAPQVGENIRLIIAQIVGTFVTMINPEILSFSQESEVMQEGCLSLPDVWGMVRRPREVSLRFHDERNQEQIFHLSGLDARVVQHEIDHLDGVLFIDRIADEKGADSGDRSVSE